MPFVLGPRLGELARKGMLVCGLGRDKEWGRCEILKDRFGRGWERRGEGLPGP